MAIRFLLINGKKDNYWKKVLEESLAPLGKLYVINANNATTRITSEKYDIVVVDATAVEDVELIVSSLRAKQKDSRIVVVTASPTWQRARAAFEAGAIDYIQKSFDKISLLEIFTQILQKPLPRWPR